MAQDSNKIVKLLKEMKKCNTLSSESIDKLLECIETNIDSHAKGDTNILLEEYISNLANSIDNKFAITTSKLKNIEKTLKSIYATGKSALKEPEINKNFDNFLNSVKSFNTTAKDQRSLLKDIESKVHDLKNISKKETVGEIKNSLSQINNTFKKFADDVNKNLKPVITVLTDESVIGSKRENKKKIESIFKDTEEIVNMLQQHNVNDSSLEEIYKNITTSHNLKYTQGIVDCIINKAEQIESSFADYKASDDVQTTISKDDYFDLKKCTEQISLKTDEVKQILGKVTKDIEAIPDTDTLEKPLLQVYSKLDNLLANISASNVKGDIFDLNSSFSLLREDLSTVKNIIEDLNDVLTNKISSQANKLGSNMDIESLRETIFKMAELIPTKEDIENLLTKMEVELNTSKNDIEDIRNSQTNIENSITNLATKEDVQDIGDKISEVKFDQEFSDIYNKTTSIEDWLVHSKIKENTEDIASQLSNKAEQEDVVSLKEQISAALSKLSEKDTMDILGSTLSDVSKKIEKIQDEFLSTNQIIDNKTTHIEDQLVSISEYISKLPANDEIIKEKIEEIKTLIEDKYHLKEDKDKQYVDIAQKVSENLEQMFTKKLQIPASEEFNDAISGIKSSIINYNTDNSSQLSEIIKSIDGINSIINKKEDLDTELKYSISELDGLKAQISDVIDLLKKNEELKSSENDQTFEAYSANTNNFICERLAELKDDLGSTVGENETQMQQGFVYNTELIEEKTEAILNFIKNATDNEEFNNSIRNNFKEVEDKLSDFKQQIELLNTDLIENLTSKTDSISEALLPLKEQLNEAANSKEIKNLEDKFESLKTIIETSLNNDEEEKEESTEITESLSMLERNIRDYMLGDIDSVIVKVDELKDYIDSSVKTIVPPDPEKMQELHDYVKDINEFQKSQHDLIQNATDIIQENMAMQHDEIKSMIANSMNPDYIIEGVKNLIETNNTSTSNEESIEKLEEIRNEISENNNSLKSMLTVAMNHDELISVIEDLKQNFETKLKKFKNSASDNDNISNSNLDDLRDNLDHYSSVIEKLTGQNEDIASILQNIEVHLDNIEDTQNSISDKVKKRVKVTDTVQTSEFDFTEAFDILKKDIDTLKFRIDGILSNDNFVDKESLENIDSKLEKALDRNWLADIKEYISSNNIAPMLEVMSSKMDILAQANNDLILEDISESINDVSQNIDELQNNIGNTNSKIVKVESKIDDFGNNIHNVESNIEDVKNRIGDFESSINSVATSINSVESSINNVTTSINSVENLITPVENSINKLSLSDEKITSMLDTLNQKIDLISETGGTISDIEEVKDLIHEQQEYISSLEPNDKMDAFKSCLDKLTVDVNKISSENNTDIKNDLKDMKDTLMGAVVNIFDQVSFVEESEDIKDFVEERTDQINENIAQITRQLQQLTTSGEINDYSYSMQDIETDLSKLRLALNEIQNSGTGLPTGELAKITEKLHSITSSVDSLTQEEMKALKDEITNIKEQTRFLIVSADKSYNAMVGEDFGGKINNITKMLEKSNNSDNVVRKALIYMGEWIDSASENMNNINRNSEDIKSIIDNLKTELPNQTQILNVLENKVQNLESEISTMKNIENEITSQQERIDRLEMNIDKILSAIENIDDFGLTGKVEKIDKQISRLSTSIEKLTAYVD